MSTKQFKRKLVIRNVKEDFAGMGEGVIAQEVIVTPESWDPNDPWNCVVKTDSDMEFLNKHIEIVWEETDEEGTV